MGRSAGRGPIRGGGKINACFKMTPPVVEWSYLHIAGGAKNCGYTVGNQIVASSQLYMVEVGLGNVASGVGNSGV